MMAPRLRRVALRGVALRMLRVIAALSAFAGAARASVDVRALSRALQDGGAAGGLLGHHDFSAIVEVPDGEDPAAAGLTRMGTHWSAVRAPLGDLAALALAHPTWQVTWSAPLHPLLDRAAEWARAPAFRTDTGFTGKGAYVGIVDTGIDVLHPDFRNPDGSTRIAYLIDFGVRPAGLENLEDKDAEAQCPGPPATRTQPVTTPLCTVFDKAAIDRLIASGQAPSLSHDTEGHGTHVASLAAGNGGAAGRYVGIAPDAPLVVARVLDATNSIGDAAVLTATNLVFYLADRDKLPAVVNLSLGSDFGPHDGTAPLERSLAELVGPSHPGRSIVVAAGNSAGLLYGAPNYPDPLGVHTEVDVPELADVQVPIATRPPAAATTTVNGTLLVWIAFRPGDDLAVGVDRNGAGWIAPRGPGFAGSYGDKNTLSVTIVNQVLSQIPSLDLQDAMAAAVVIDGTWPKDDRFSIRLSGHGTAGLWIQSEGDFGPEASGVALLPAATRQATITIPATHSSLIAVGATLNRLDWTDRDGDAIRVHEFGGPTTPPLDSVAFFSSAGPTTDLRIKPDLVAPGAFVVGAMGRDADPAVNKTSMFAASQFCDPSMSCAVVDGTHAVGIGTSMAAPIVTGAVALLLQGDPTLSQDRILTLLQAGARRPRGNALLDAQLGAGALDLEGTLDVERALVNSITREPDAATSWMSLGQSYAHPDPTWSVPGLLELRDKSGKIADLVDAAALRLDVRNGSVTSPLERVAPGFYRFAVAASTGSGGATLTVDAVYGKSVLVSKEELIAVDVNVARAGFTGHGGCAVSPSGERRAPPLAVVATSVVIALLGRRYRRGARRARNPDRTDTKDRARRGSFRR
jgi:subtilisin family serine protease